MKSTEVGKKTQPFVNIKTSHDPVQDVKKTTKPGS